MSFLRQSTFALFCKSQRTEEFLNSHYLSGREMFFVAHFSTISRRTTLSLYDPRVVGRVDILSCSARRRTGELPTLVATSLPVCSPSRQSSQDASITMYSLLYTSMCSQRVLSALYNSVRAQSFDKRKRRTSIVGGGDEMAVVVVVVTRRTAPERGADRAIREPRG